MSKKTTSIEVRMSPEMKSQVEEVCKQRRESMSKLIRRLVQDETSEFLKETTHSGVRRVGGNGAKRLRDMGLVSVSLITLAVAWNLATQAPATAQAEVRLIFAELDRNEDGVITQPEFDRYTRADAERNWAELPQACKIDPAVEDNEDPAKALSEFFAEFDGNKDGRVVYKEVQVVFLQERGEEFTKIDTDADGFLTRREFDIAVTADDSEEDDKDLSPECRQALEEGGEPLETEELRLLFAIFDEDRDSRISRDEFKRGSFPFD